MKYTVQLTGQSAEGQRRRVWLEVEAESGVAAIDAAWRSEWALMRRDDSVSDVALSTPVVWK